ncbi:MAG TPA: aminotransferase class V-fold PLP-dependent enzyme [Bacteroidota bacterium]|nr:aminotransferase class V-fold PLP-dependent enzyme [Bacteroidota bacterium]
MKRRKFFIASAGMLAATQALDPRTALAEAFLRVPGVTENEQGAGAARHAAGVSQQGAGAAHNAARPLLQRQTGVVTPEDGRFWDDVRAQFPLRKDRMYLNTGGLGASPYAVIDAVKTKMDELEAICETGHTDELWNSIKAEAASLLGCDAGELAFTRNTTEGINIVANGTALKRGDEVILTTQEHVGNAITWVGLHNADGIVLKRFEPSTVSHAETLDRLKKLITPRTRMISIPHIETTTGLIMPVKEIGAIARAKHIFFLVDGAQACGMIPVNLHELGCDAYATSGHKWLMGPKETGLLYVRRDRLDRVRAKFIGAYSDNGFDFEKEQLTFHPSAQRYEYGTVSTPLRAGLGAAIRFIHQIGMDNIWARDKAMSTALYAGLKKIDKITILSPADDSMRSAMITISHRTLSNVKLQEHLNTYELRTRIVTEGGLSALRMSLHCYNSFAEVGRILDAVRSVAVK